LRALRISEQPWFRRGEVLPPLARATGPGGVPRIQYLLFRPPIETARFAERHEDRDACLELREEVAASVEKGITQLSGNSSGNRPGRWTEFGLSVGM
jgi:hypothetical protein